MKDVFRMNSLVTIAPSKHLTLYNNMRTAIAKCCRFDECKDIIDKSVAMAAYHKQIKDTETERKFYQVKLRAWRRIGEMFSTVDLSDCVTQREKIQKVRDKFGKAVAEFSDSRIYEVLRLMTVPDASFEIALKQITNGGLSTLYQFTPEAAAERKANRDAQEKAAREWEKQKASPAYQKKLQQEREQQAELERQEAMEQQNTDELWEASEAAMKEVGITLERKDRTGMKQVVFLIKDEVHAVMRKAAFDEKITMQEILRRGLKMWLIAHDYTFPETEAGRSARSPKGAEHRPV